ncbi:MAG TPA: malto-oligosyltrehalose trehalohydrolase, partial [Acetobacteraceae bacterium]|nr:malto-oligosyltrehalose trehalohydrolase [Acetobacteraceae bacterium]
MRSVPILAGAALDGREQTGRPEFRRRFGPVQQGGWTCLQLWAPGAEDVRAVINIAEPLPLQKDSEGYWRIWCRVVPGDRYQFIVDSHIVPDPASWSQPDGVEGASAIAPADRYEWRTPHWQGRPWEEAVLYEAHVGIMGGYRGLGERLPALSELGITVVELMPIAEFPGERNWGYDGVFPFAPARSYGSPDDLRALIDEAHRLDMMVMLDVVYNHFGPQGNMLPSYAAEFFDPGCATPWGAAIDFRKPPVRRFFIENAIYWLTSFRFDGLRLDAVHAICDRTFLTDLSAEVRRVVTGRHVHLVLENEHNQAALLEGSYAAQWNDDFHNSIHVLLTGETHGYYGDFADQPASKLARCLSEGFAYQGEQRITRPDEARGQPSGHLQPTAFINFLQNHDQVGNRAVGERLTTLVQRKKLQAAFALLLLCPQIPMIFMGEECGAREPFLFFTDYKGELGDAVRNGRANEFAGMPGFSSPNDLGSIPDPNAVETFCASRWRVTAPDADGWLALTKHLLSLRARLVAPYLVGCVSLGSEAIGAACVMG